MIPVRVPADAVPVLGNERRFDIGLDHPLVWDDCPVCDRPFIEAPCVLVFVGIAPESRKPAGVVTGAAVVVHARCAGAGE